MIQTAGRWSWKSKPAKECVTTHLPNQLAPKMDGAEARRLDPAVGASEALPMSRRARAPAAKAGARARLERRLVQILVVVATIQVRTLKTEVEEGSM